MAAHDSTYLRLYLSSLVKETLGIDLDTLSSLWTRSERRKARRVGCDATCDMELGFEASRVCKVELKNISTMGCLVSMPAWVEPTEHMYEIEEISLTLDDGESLRLYGTIVRVESDCFRDDGASLLVGFCFTALDEENRDKLCNYIDNCYSKARNCPDLVEVEIG
jgi:hypothetical protein